MNNVQHFVSGALWAGSSVRTGDVFNPATGAVAAKVCMASTADVDHAVAAALRAQPAWGATPPARRAAVMFEFRNLLYSHTDELAEMLSAEHGKTLADAKGELARGIEVVSSPAASRTPEGVSEACSASTVPIRRLSRPGITPLSHWVPLWSVPVSSPAERLC